MAGLSLPLAVIFDMDGLLLDSERLSRDTFVETCHAYDAADAAGAYSRLIGLSLESQRDVFRQILPAHVNRARFDRDWRALFLHRSADCLPLKPGAERLCRWLKRAEIPMAVATSTLTGKAELMLERAALRGFMASVIGGDRVRQGKPSPDLYLAAAAALGEHPERCLAFEDSAHGVKAAYEAGMPVIQVPDLMPADDATRGMTVAIASDLLDAAAQLGWPVE